MEKTRNAHTVVRMRLTQALIELMAEKPYDAISVTEIAMRAQVARVSFYRNFDSKDDILKAHARGLTEGFLASIAPGLRAYDSRAYVTMLLEHMREQRNLISLLIDAGRMDIVRGEFDRAFGVEGGGGRDAVRRSFLSGGLYNLFYTWALGGYEPDPAQIADFVCEMVR